jgi:tetratricopeptide (TPR) repeat protein
MSLSAGDRLGRYEILGPLGAGGMGEVYRARDTELEREVAIKVLPEAVAQNLDRLERFKREARAVAKLAHPNILEIWDFGTDGDITYSVTELLEGETLRERLEGGTLGWRRATETGAAIADGLAAAHEAGIVHRDLKPSNVFVTNDGRVKVLDFGLARHDSLEGEESGTEAPTLTRHTDPGTVLGTVGYMSPEQVSGRTVDHRSDIFSLGCVLYEMVSGQRAFARDTAVETMNAILKEEPADIATSGAALPPELAGTVRRCLEKKPQSRFQSASDLAYNLRTVSSASTPTATGRMPTTTVRTTRWWLPWFAVAAGVLLAVATAIALWAPWKQPPPEDSFDVELEWVAVAPLENRTGDPSLDTLGQRAVDLIVQRFSETGRSDGVLTKDAVPYPPGGAPKGEAAQGQDSYFKPLTPKGPHVMVSGSYYLEGDDLQFQARLSDYESGELVYAFQAVTGDRAHPSETLSVLAERVVAAVNWHWYRDSDIRTMSPPSSQDALVAFYRGAENYSVDYDESISAYRKASELDPEWLAPRAMIILAYANKGTFDEAREELASIEGRFVDLTLFERLGLSWLKAKANHRRMEALAFLRQAVEVAPHVTTHRDTLVAALANVNRHREVVEVLAPLLSKDQPDSPFPDAWFRLDVVAHAHHALGEYEEQLRWAKVGRQRYPDVGAFFFHIAVAHAAMGQVDAIRTVMDECTRVQLRDSGMTAGEVMSWAARELKFHGHRQQSEDLAVRAAQRYQNRTAGVDLGAHESEDLDWYSRVLRVAGRWDEARVPLRELQERGYRPIKVAGALSVIAAHDGNRDEALRISNELPDPDSQFGRAERAYWRACIASYLGDEDQAVDLLRLALSEGYYMNSYWLHTDPNLEPLWDNTEFQELIRPQG